MANAIKNSSKNITFNFYYLFLFRFGVVCAFVTNEQMEDGAKNLAPSVRTSLRDTDLYLNNTKLVFNNKCVFFFISL